MGVSVEPQSLKWLETAGEGRVSADLSLNLTETHLTKCKRESIAPSQYRNRTLIETSDHSQKLM